MLRPITFLSLSYAVVNDNTYRHGEEAAKGSSANLETQFLFREGRVHLGFYTTIDVDEGEELVSQYGEAFWKTINKQLIAEHKKFFDYIEPYTRVLELTTVKAALPLPAHPPMRWDIDGEDKFSPKPRAYPHLESVAPFSLSSRKQLDGDDAAAYDEGAHEVERILQMRTDDAGRKEYLVRWKHSSNSENEWIKEKNIIACTDAIQEFEAGQLAATTSAAKRAGGGHKHSKDHSHQARSRKK
jgi:hypothetical protein